MSASQGGVAVFPDGREVAAVFTDQKVYVYSTEGAEPQLFPGLEYGEVPVQWSEDGTALYVLQPTDTPAKIFWVERKTAKRTLWMEISPRPIPPGCSGWPGSA